MASGARLALLLRCAFSGTLWSTCVPDMPDIPTNLVGAQTGSGVCVGEDGEDSRFLDRLPDGLGMFVLAGWRRLRPWRQLCTFLTCLISGGRGLVAFADVRLILWCDTLSRKSGRSSRLFIII